MNYIHQLQSDLTEARDRLAQINELATDAMVYLTSRKFHDDTTVQVSDVLARLAIVRVETL